MAKPELGGKRQCQSCATKFYDLNKDPIICPKCGATFHVAALSRAAAGRAEPEEDAEAEKESPDVVSLEEVAEKENAAEAIDDEVEIESDDAEDDTFLEEEEGEDDVAALIDGDLESDEET